MRTFRAEKLTPTLEISEHGGWVEARAAGGDQSGTAILAVPVTDHRLEACATFGLRTVEELELRGELFPSIHPLGDRD
jgi:hypothetical protein